MSTPYIIAEGPKVVVLHRRAIFYHPAVTPDIPHVRSELPLPMEGEPVFRGGVCEAGLMTVQRLIGDVLHVETIRFPYPEAYKQTGREMRRWLVWSRTGRFWFWAEVDFDPDWGDGFF